MPDILKPTWWAQHGVSSGRKQRWKQQLHRQSLGDLSIRRCGYDGIPLDISLRPQFSRVRSGYGQLLAARLGSLPVGGRLYLRAAGSRRASGRFDEPTGGSSSSSSNHHLK